AGSSLEAQVRKHLEHAGPAGRTIAELATAIAVDQASVGAVVRSHPDVFFHESGERAFLRSVLAAGIDEVVQGVDRMLKSKPLAASVAKSALRTSRTLPQVLLDAVLDELQREGRVRGGAGGRLVFVERMRPLSPEDQAVVDQVCAVSEAADLKP